MKRALCIWLPQWPLQRLAAAREELRQRAVVLYELHASGSARVVAYASHLASAAAAPWDHDPRRTAGIRPGMPLAEATALASYTRERAARPARATKKSATVEPPHPALPSLHLELADPLADRMALVELAQWCQRFSPTAGVDQGDSPESLLLDVTGLGVLTGSEHTLAEQVVREFHERHLTPRVAIADTPGAAWAVAHGSTLEIPSSTTSSMSAIVATLGVPLVVPAGESAVALGPLDVEALQLPPATCELLAELGLRRIEHLMALPRATLLSRFGPLVLEKLDRATGAAPEAIAACQAPAELQFEWLLEHPTDRREMIEFALGQLISQVCDMLSRERRGILQLRCRLEHEQRPPLEWIVGLYRASASARHIEDLVRLKLESVRLRDAVSAIRLAVLRADRLEFHQQEMFAQDRRRESPRALATLVDRLSNRLGAQAVLKPWLLASAQPEFTCHYKPLTTHVVERRPRRAVAPPAQPASVSGDRPLFLENEPRLLSVMSVAPEGPPIQFRLAGRDERIAQAWGPERIETSWWRSRCVRRDYYQVELTDGRRFWLFRQLNTGRWYLHGDFS